MSCVRVNEIKMRMMSDNVGVALILRIYGRMPHSFVIELVILPVICHALLVRRTCLQRCNKVL